MMEKCLAFVLGGGGGRGSMQIGALRALFEAGYKPDLLVGTSIGAVNAAGLAFWGTNQDGITALELAYQKMEEGHLMDQRPDQLAFHALSGRPNRRASQRIADLAISMGITSDIRFSQAPHARLAMIGTDLETGKTVVYGQDLSQSVLDGLLASTAIPPWFAPVEKDAQLIIDGGILSNLPIEPALTLGATDVIALDLMNDPASLHENIIGASQQFEKVIFAVLQRQAYVESALAEAQRVPVHYLQLRSSPPIPIWDFSNYRELIKIGYDIACHEIAGWHKTKGTLMS
ncbi:MAG: patatin-like phospholipase family protein [Anaerolineales bacterium]|nr:patatin-like phospholipase family protein [Anaerolineales bacterium]